MHKYICIYKHVKRNEFKLETYLRKFESEPYLKVLRIIEYLNLELFENGVWMICNVTDVLKRIFFSFRKMCTKCIYFCSNAKIMLIYDVK